MGAGAPRRGRARSTRWSVAALLVTVAVPAVSLAGAPPRGGPVPPHAVTVAAGTRSALSARVATAWTPARMRAAAPAETLVAAAANRFVRRTALSAYLDRLLRSRSAPSVPPPLPADIGTPWTRGGRVTRTTGKVFFHLGRGDYVCSGSAILSADRSTVLTAGHCADDPETGAQATEWVFVPGYRRGATPYGVFPATAVVSAQGWRTGGDFDVDLAFANVDRNAAGVLLTDAVGGQPVAFDTPRGRPAVALGYPAEAPWDGEVLVGCAGPLRQDTGTTASTDQGIACSMTGGSSGGPWLSGFDAATGTGTVTSLTSFGYSDRPGVLWGPYLGPVARALFTKVAGTTAT